MREQVHRARRWVVKIGSALLTNDGRGLYLAAIEQWVRQIVELRQRGIEVVLVSSGAVAEGMVRLGWKTRPHALHELQAAAAVGQMGLVQAYESQFQRYGLHTAQVLLGHDDISARDRYLNARGTLQTLVQLGVVPVINENDTVVTDEIRFGDNDTLGALVANLIDADLLVILTDQEGLFDADPRHNAGATLVAQGRAGDPQYEQMAGGGGALGRGGMLTKIRAAKLAARSGAATVIASGRQDNVLIRLADGEDLGTLLVADQQPLAARKQWLAGLMQIGGQLILDDGAVRVLRDSGRSLLPVGVKSISGKFRRGDLVSCVDLAGNEIARGLANYSVEDTQKIIGFSSDKIEEILGYQGEKELIHRDNLIVM
ncbi:MAG: glutamate 5-kinase [Verrucomicrobiaceae bacterium]|nr:glutamate 5-kinase [Verrucomicrobiaceae bacterium]